MSTSKQVRLLLALSVVTGAVGVEYFLDFVNGQHLNWTSYTPDGTPTGRSGKIEFELGWGGPNAPDEDGSGGMTRRLVLAWDEGSCMELCTEPALSSQACVTSTERGQIPGVPIKDSILLYVYTRARDFDSQGNRCLGSWGPSRPFGE
jgi:hypothetical protein